jgi:hypothetical protein
LPAGFADQAEHLPRRSVRSCPTIWYQTSSLASMQAADFKEDIAALAGGFCRGLRISAHSLSPLVLQEPVDEVDGDGQQPMQPPSGVMSP